MFSFALSIKKKYIVFKEKYDQCLIKVLSFSSSFLKIIFLVSMDMLLPTN